MTSVIPPARPVRLRPGKGVLARYEGLTLLFETRDDRLTGELLREAGLAARADQPGRRLGQALARLLASSGDGLPALCAFGRVEGGTAALVHGSARLTVRTDADALVLDGRDAVTMSDRIVPGVLSEAHGVLGADVSAAPADPWCEIESGVVRADALWLAASSPGATAEAGAAAEPPTAPVPEPDHVPPPVAPDSSTAPTGSGTGTDAGTGTGTDAGAETANVRIFGALCRRGHFNDPSLRYCGTCGLGLTQAGRVPARSRRPALGVLVLDDGRMFPLDRDHVLGRTPEHAGEVRSGAVAAVPLDDPTVSGVHARIGLDGWEVSVTDRASRRGTYLRAPGARDWERLADGARTVVRPGTVIAVGRRQLRYDSYRRD